MRLTCPNCGAQYEVPDEVIPTEGRDVQCSNCGDTWYQAHPDHPEAADEPETARKTKPETAPEFTQRQDAEPRHDAPEAEEQSYQDDGNGTDDDSDDDPDSGVPVPGPTPPQPDLDVGISDILREEAKREAHLRAAEASDPLESQPDLGLDNAAGDGPSQRAQEARSRMARMRGEPNTESGAAETGSRRELLPDIEEISSTLRSGDDGATSANAVGPVRVEATGRKRGGFSRGFALIVIIGVIMAIVYVNAAKITAAVPQTESAVGSYVSMIDQARVWLDARLGEFIPDPND